ncbi:hypothetical protein ACP275_03G035700 [Erythranthe tilingii]
MSLTSDDDMATRPMSVVISFNSANIQAKTENAVMDCAALIKTRNGALLTTPFKIVSLSTNDVPTPNANRRVIPDGAMLNAFYPVCRRDLGFSSRPGKNIKNRRPKLATVYKTVRLCGGKIAWT